VRVSLSKNTTPLRLNPLGVDSQVGQLRTPSLDIHSSWPS